MDTDLIKNKGENIRFNLIVFLHTVVPIGITVFLFSTKYNLNIYISTLFTYKDGYKSFRADGSQYRVRRQRYICTNKAMKRGICDGQSAYVAHRIDGAVLVTL